MCCKMIINSGIRRVVYQEGYPDPFTLELFDEAGVKLEKTGGSLKIEPVAENGKGQGK